VKILEILTRTLLQIVILIALFIVLTLLAEFIYKKLKNNYFKSINMNDYLPEDEVHTLRQVFYLIMMALCVVNIFYSILGTTMDIYYLTIFDIVLSLYIAITLDKSSRKNKILFLLLVPYESLSYFFNVDLVVLLIMGIIHILIFLYFAKFYFDKFMEYTDSHGLGITIILLFVIIFASFFITQYAEGVNALDSLVMISNQFTGNGYAIFGHSISGKLNSLLLVWGGYVISGAGAATLTAAILIKHFRKRFEELEKLIEGDEE
jgi:hypothetical protein